MYRYLDPRTGIRALRDWSVNRLYHWLKLAELRDQANELERIKAQIKSCGRDVHLHYPLRLIGGGQMTVGNNVHIGENAFIRAKGGLTIGDNTRISRNLVLYTSNHRYEGELLPYDEGKVTKPVVIGKNVWIGMNVCIVPGTHIGDGAVIGMGTTVSGVVPPLAVVGSAKWRLIGHRDSARYQLLDSEARYADPQGLPYTETSELVLTQ